MNFGFYLLFLTTGGIIGAYLGWRFMRWQWSDKRTEEQKTWLGMLLAAIVAALGASR